MFIIIINVVVTAATTAHQYCLFYEYLDNLEALDSFTAVEIHSFTDGYN